MGLLLAPSAFAARSAAEIDALLKGESATASVSEDDVTENSLWVPEGVVKYQRYGTFGICVTEISAPIDIPRADDKYQYYGFQLLADDEDGRTGLDSYMYILDTLWGKARKLSDASAKKPFLLFRRDLNIPEEVFQASIMPWWRRICAGGSNNYINLKLTRNKLSIGKVPLSQGLYYIKPKGMPFAPLSVEDVIDFVVLREASASWKRVDERTVEITLPYDYGEWPVSSEYAAYTVTQNGQYVTNLTAGVYVIKIDEKWKELL
jgi:hypothetical protein